MPTLPRQPTPRWLPAAGLLAFAALAFPLTASAAGVVPAPAGGSWWVWALGTFVACFFMGIAAVPAGVGGGVLFVPIVSGFFPFHLDFVRGAGLLVAMASTLAAGPSLLRNGMVNLRLVMPLALSSSLSSIAGAMVGLALPAWLVQTLLGTAILAIAALMIAMRKSEFPHVPHPDPLSRRLGIHGVFRDPIAGTETPWQVHRTATGIVLFLAIGFLGGLLGVGAGWANVPGLNLMMGVPLKLAAASSSLILSIASASATWYYLNSGAILPVIAVPSVIGMMMGARIGAHLLTVLNPAAVRRLVIAMLLFAGARALLKGLGY